MATKSMTIQLNNIFDEYRQELSAELGEEMDRIADEAVKQLKQTSPRGRSSKHYADGWTKKRIIASGTLKSVVVYNKTAPGLTHLLNDGHAVSNQYGDYGHPKGRVKGDEHITKVNTWATAEFERAARRIGG